MVIHTLPKRLHLLAADVLELAVANALLARGPNHHGDVHEQDEEDKRDEFPPAKEPSGRIWDKCTEHEETVGADEGQRLIDKLKCVRRWEGIGVELTLKDHEHTLLEDEELDLEVAAFEPEDADTGVGDASQHKKHWTQEGNP